VLWPFETNEFPHHILATVSTGTPNTPGAFQAVPPVLYQAYRDGDYNTILKYTDMTSTDLNPIYQNIRENAEKEGIEVQLCCEGRAPRVEQSFDDEETG
jgi:hypothetical protein